MRIKDILSEVIKQNKDGDWVVYDENGKEMHMKHKNKRNAERHERALEVISNVKKAKENKKE